MLCTSNFLQLLMMVFAFSCTGNQELQLELLLPLLNVKSLTRVCGVRVDILAFYIYLCALNIPQDIALSEIDVNTNMNLICLIMQRFLGATMNHNLELFSVLHKLDRLLLRKKLIAQTNQCLKNVHKNFASLWP